MATNEKRQYWINLKRTNPEEYARRSRRYYWHHLQQTNPEEFKRQKREHKLMEKHEDMTKAEAHRIVETQDRINRESQLSLF